MLIARLILSYVVLIFADAFKVASRRARGMAASQRAASGPVETRPQPVPATTASPAIRPVKRPSLWREIFAAGKELFTRFGKDNSTSWAAALSFFSILSIPPFLLCCLAILGFVIRSPRSAARQTVHIVGRLLPGSGARKAARNLIEQLNIERSAEEIRKRRGTAGAIGIGLLLWSSMQIFVSASAPLNAAFQVPETRSWLRLRFTALCLQLGSALLFALSLLPAAGVRVIRMLHVPIMSSLPMPSPFWVGAVLWIIGIAVNMALFTVIYRFLPSPAAKVTWRVAGFGGMVASILWEIAKQGFGLYLVRMGGAASYDKVYGSLGGLVLLVFWIYYTSILLLLGAEIAKMYAEWLETGGAGGLSRVRADR